MIRTFNYQLNCNKKHNCYFYIKSQDNLAKIYIYKYIDSEHYDFKSLTLSFQPISCGWIQNNIFLLSNTKLFLLDVSAFDVREILLPAYKIVDMISLQSDDEYIYSTIIDPDFIDFYLKKHSGDDIKIASFYIEKNKLAFFVDEILSINKNLINEYIKEFKLLKENNINDFANNHKLQIKRTNLNSDIIVDGHCIKTVFGCVDRAFFFGEKIVYTYSSLIKPPRVYEMNLGVTNINNGLNDNLENTFSIKHYDDIALNIHYYKFCKKGAKKGTIIMLHGGPSARYSNRFYPMTYSFANTGYVVYLLNYPGSLGYGYEYQEQLYGNAGIIDYETLLNFINALIKNNCNLPLYLVGDSYGAYLGILILLKSQLNITKVYALNAFTDIRHQYLFSNSRFIIEKYFTDIRSKNIKKINPIDLVTDDQIKNRLMIINGIDDKYCPKEQIIQFKKISGCEVILLSNYPHFVTDYEKMNEVTNILLKDMEKNTCLNLEK